MRDNEGMKALAKKHIQIRGEKWQIEIIQDEIFFEKHGEGCAGITLLDKKKIQIPERDLSFVTILHEVFHAYASYLHLGSADIQGHQSEEIFAELFSSYGVQMIDIAKKIMLDLSKKLKLQLQPLVQNLSEDQQEILLAPAPRRQPPKRRSKRT